MKGRYNLAVLQLQLIFTVNLLFNLFLFINIDLFGCTGSSLLCVGFLCCSGRGLLFVLVGGLLIALVLLWSTASQIAGFSSSSTQA